MINRIKIGAFGNKAYQQDNLKVKKRNLVNQNLSVKEVGRLILMELRKIRINFIMSNQTPKIDK
jgi:hypothetical protein